MNTIQKINVLGKNIYCFNSKKQVLELLNENKIFISLNAEILNSSNIRLEKIINENVGYADGIGAVLAIKRKGGNVVKIPGVELWIHVIANTYKNNSFYLIGSTETVIQKTIEKLRSEYNDINIVGFRNGYLDKEGHKNLQKDIAEKTPDIVFVAIGSPMQEYMADELLKLHKANYFTLGGSFDVYSGLKSRAPKIFIFLGLEWLYRLLKEPTRFKRQLNLFIFAFKVILNKI